MLITDAVEAYLYMTRLTPALAESQDQAIGEIAAKAALGDGAAVGEIYMRYLSSLTAIARGIVGPNAEDVVQEIFTRLVQGKFAKMAPTFKADGRSVFATLATAARREAINSKKRQAKAGGSLTPSDDYRIDPADPTSTHDDTTLSTDERQLVRTVVQRAIDQSKLTSQERKYIEALLGRPGEEVKDITRFFSSATDVDRDEKTLQDIARSIWPEKTANAAGVTGNRVRARFLKQFCDDPELLKLLPGGKASLRDKQLKPVCAEGEDPVLFVAKQLDIVTEGAESDRDRAYAGVLRWVRHLLI